MSRPQCWHGPCGPALEVILTQKQPSDNQVGSWPWASRQRDVSAYPPWEIVLSCRMWESSVSAAPTSSKAQMTSALGEWTSPSCPHLPSALGQQ